MLLLRVLWVGSGGSSALSPLLPFIWQVHGLWGVKLIRIQKFLDNPIGIAHSRFLVSLLLENFRNGSRGKRSSQQLCLIRTSKAGLSLLCQLSAAINRGEADPFRSEEAGEKGLSVLGQ